MQWRNIRGMKDAYSLDLLIARMEVAVLLGSAQLADLKIELMDRLANLQMHLNPVREKAEVLKRVKSDEFWNGLTVSSLEEVRTPLREIMHHRERQNGPALPPKIVDITEGEIGLHYNRRSTSLRTVDMKAYQQVVEMELKRHFDSDPTLKKIRAGENVSEADIHALVSMVLTQSPNASKDVLRDFFRSVAEPLDFVIRSIIGLEPTVVAQRFSQFARKHPALTAKQTRFLALLQNHIARYGSITVDRLPTPSPRRPRATPLRHRDDLPLPNGRTSVPDSDCVCVFRLPFGLCAAQRLCPVLEGKYGRTWIQPKYAAEPHRLR
jgi:type I restriction enzyme R subunit